MANSLLLALMAAMGGGSLGSTPTESYPDPGVDYTPLPLDGFGKPQNRAFVENDAAMVAVSDQTKGMMLLEGAVEAIYSAGTAIPITSAYVRANSRWLTTLLAPAYYDALGVVMQNDPDDILAVGRKVADGSASAKRGISSENPAVLGAAAGAASTARRFIDHLPTYPEFESILLDTALPSLAGGELTLFRVAGTSASFSAATFVLGGSLIIEPLPRIQAEAANVIANLIRDLGADGQLVFHSATTAGKYLGSPILDEAAKDLAKRLGLAEGNESVMLGILRGTAEYLAHRQIALYPHEEHERPVGKEWAESWVPASIHSVAVTIRTTAGGNDTALVRVAAVDGEANLFHFTPLQPDYTSCGCGKHHNEEDAAKVDIAIAEIKSSPRPPDDVSGDPAASPEA